MQNFVTPATISSAYPPCPTYGSEIIPLETWERMFFIFFIDAPRADDNCVGSRERSAEGVFIGANDDDDSEAEDDDFAVAMKDGGRG